MRLHGTYTVALIHDDLSIYTLKGRFPIQPAELRKRNLELCGHVDAVGVVYHTDPSESLQNEVTLIPGSWTFVRGDDMPEFPGRAEVERLGVPIVLVPYTEGVSSSERREACR